MTSRARGGGGPRWKVLALAIGVWACSAVPSAVYAGGHKGEGLWGEYGYGPHFYNRSCAPTDFGFPYFTHPMGCGVPYLGYVVGQSSGYPYFGPYTGAPPYPDVVPAYDMDASPVKPRTAPPRLTLPPDAARGRGSAPTPRSSVSSR